MTPAVLPVILSVLLWNPPTPVSDAVCADSAGAGQPSDQPPGPRGPVERGCVACQSGDIAEGEPICADGYVDNFNGGCSSSPPAFVNLVCGQTVCGTYGTFLSGTGANLRDTDVYRFTLNSVSSVSWVVTGEARSRLFIFLGPVCPSPSLDTMVAEPCVETTLSVTALVPGTYFAFVAPDSFTGVPCGSHYRATLLIEGCACIDDFNHDGVVNSQDFFDFLTAFFSNNPSADVNGDGVINSQDYFDFVTVFFTGC